MPDRRQPEQRSGVHAVLGIGLAALALAGGVAFFLALFGLVLREYGFGVMLIVAVGGLLLFGALVDLRRKHRGSRS